MRLKRTESYMADYSKKTAVIIYPRVSAQASRLLKQAKFLIENNVVDKVIILAMLQESKFESVVELSDNVKLRRIKTLTYDLPKNAFGDTIKFLEFFFRCIQICYHIRPALIIPHSLSVLPIGVWMKKFKKTRLIYDAHELETERYELKGLRKFISKLMERTLIKSCEKVIVVNDRIAEWYVNAYKLSNVYSIPNIPQHPHPGKLVSRTTLLRDQFNISSNDIIFIYQGILSKGRGVVELLEIFTSGLLSEDRHLVLMGYGEMEDEVKKAAIIYPNIHFKTAVHPSEIISYTSSADVGIVFILDENLCLSYRLSLSNKFFEYTIAGLYICLNDKFTVMQELIEENHLGSAVESNSDSIAKFLQTITKQEIEAEYTKSAEYRKTIDWEQNNEKLKQVFVYN